MIITRVQYRIECDRCKRAAGLEWRTNVQDAEKDAADSDYRVIVTNVSPVKFMWLCGKCYAAELSDISAGS